MPNKVARKTKTSVVKGKKRPAKHSGNGVRKNEVALSGDLDKLLQKVCELIDSTSHYEYALAKLALQSSARIAAGGFKDAKQFWEEWVRKARPDQAPSYATLTRWMRVARTWPEEVAGSLGFEKLDTTLTWLNLKGLAAPKEPTTISFDVPGRGLTKFADCTFKDIAAAIHALKAGEPRPLDPKVIKLKKDVEDAMNEVLPHGAAHVRLVLHQDHPFFDFKSIPAEQLDGVCKALLAKVVKNSA